MKKEQDAVNNQDVSEALALLGITLKEEKDRIFQDGSKAMAAQDTVTARAVLDFADKLELFTKDVQNLIAKWSELLKEREAASPAVQRIVTGEGKLFGMRTRKAAGGYTRKVDHPLAVKSNFYVEFPDGTVIQTTKAAETFAMSIDKLGAERVQALSLILCGDPLVSRQVSKKYPTASKKISKGYYVNTHSNTALKIAYLKKIAELLKIELKIALLKS